MEKMGQLLGELCSALEPVYAPLQSVFPEAFQTGPKISKGEQLEHLPYLILDYPRFFSNETVFASRTLFWWGRGFYVIHHLKGLPAQRLLNKLDNSIEELAKLDFRISINGFEWQHDTTAANYFDLLDETWKKEEVQFVKLATRLSLEQIDTITIPLIERHRSLVSSWLD